MSFGSHHLFFIAKNVLEYRILFKQIFNIDASLVSHSIDVLHWNFQFSVIPFFYGLNCWESRIIEPTTYWLTINGPYCMDHIKLRNVLRSTLKVGQLGKSDLLMVRGSSALNYFISNLITGLNKFDSRRTWVFWPSKLGSSWHSNVNGRSVQNYLCGQYTFNDCKPSQKFTNLKPQRDRKLDQFCKTSPNRQDFERHCMWNNWLELKLFEKYSFYLYFEYIGIEKSLYIHAIMTFQRHNFIRAS